jgi:predicted RNA binding protein YcfA (HicA-like mRNA interferase family)
MKRFPRDLSGKQLIKVLKKLDYYETRQVGSHVRLTTERHGVHHLTIPLNDPIKIGTLSSILLEVANHFKISKEELIDLLF